METTHALVRLSVWLQMLLLTAEKDKHTNQLQSDYVWKKMDQYRDLYVRAAPLV